MNRQELIRVLNEMGAQSQRNQAPKILYQGNLQDNSDTYYKANQLYSLQSIPAPPPALYRDTGTTTEVDKRMFFMPNPVVPTSAAQEALNQYFADKRVQEFARGQQRLAMSDIIAKQAEQNAERLIKDELDRRVNIRTAVLNATGMTPAQVQEELVREGLAGAMQSQTVFDARDQQVQNAVGQYYNRMGGETMPATLPSTNPIASTVPSIIAPAGGATVPMPAAAPAAAPVVPATAGGDFGHGTGAVPEEEELEELGEPPALEPDQAVGEYEPNSNAAAGAGGSGVTKDDLIREIIENRIDYTEQSASGRMLKTMISPGVMYAEGSLKLYDKAFLQSAVALGVRTAQAGRAGDSTVGTGR